MNPDKPANPDSLPLTERFAVTPEQDKELTDFVSSLWPKLRDPKKRKLDILRYRERFLPIPWYKKAEEVTGIKYWALLSSCWLDED